MFLFLLILRVAFLTIRERYFLSGLQNRLGPEKPTFLGIFLAIIDGLKLIIIEYIIIFFSDFILYFFLPILFFIIGFLFFFIYEINFCNLRIKYEVIFILIFISFLIIFLVLLAYLRKSKFRILGALRGVNRTLNFDIIFFLIILFLIFIFEDFKLKKSLIFWFLFMINIIFIILIEINRIPFDFIERERELVRGYNTELRGLLFILIFLCEYIIIIFYSFFLILLIFNNNFIFGFNILIFFIIIRGVYIRFRYDFLIRLCWLLLIPRIIIIYYFFCLY